MRAKLMMLSIPLVVAVLVGGLFIATTSGATVGASSAPTHPTPVACPGSTAVGSIVVACSGAGAPDVSGTIHCFGCLVNGAAKGQAVDLAFRPTGSGTTITGVEAAESLSTAASCVLTLSAPGATGTTSSLPVDLSITSTNGEVLNSVGAAQPTATKGHKGDGTSSCWIRVA